MTSEKSKVKGDDEMADLVRRGLIKLRQGEFYTAYGFDEETLQRLLPLPKRDDKKALYHKFLRAVSELTEGNEGSNVDEGNNQAKSKSNERLSELMRRRNEWIPIIKTFLSDTNSGQDPTVPLTEQKYEEAEGQSQQQDDEAEDQNLVTKRRKSSRSQVRSVVTSELKTAPDASGQPPVDAADTLLNTKPAAKKRRVSKGIVPVNDEIGNVGGSLDESSTTDKVTKKRRNSKLSKSDDTSTTTEKPKFSRTVEQQKKKSKTTSKTTGKPAVTKELLEKRRKEVKADFEARKKDILEQVPDEVKGRFRHLGFVKWSKSYLPILILSPFDVPPGPVRQQWMKMFENCKKQGRLNDMTNLLYWYGTSNMKECFSFEITRNIVSYETGCKKGYDKVPPKIQKSLDSGIALKGRDLELFNGLRDMAEDSSKDLSERKRGILNFPEEYELIDEKDIHELEDDDEDDDEDEVIDKNDDIKVDTEPAAEPAYVKDQTKELASSKPITKKPSHVVADDMDAIGEAEMSDIDAEGLEEPDSADDDDDFEPLEAKKKEAVPVNKKKRKQPPLPKSATDQTQADPKLETEASSKKKRQKKQFLSEEERKPSKGFKMTEATTTENILPSTKRSPEAEQKLFMECQERYFPLVEKWQQAIEERNVEALTEILNELNPLVDKFSASFFEAHRLNEMMRPKTKELVKESEVGTRFYHDVWKKMKAAYKEKKASMPDDFVLSKRQQRKDTSDEDVKHEMSEAATGKRLQSDGRENIFLAKHHEKDETKGIEATNAPELSRNQASPVPRKRSNDDELFKQARSEASSSQPAPIALLSQGVEAKSPARPTPQASVATTKPEKKKFSLGNLMRPKEVVAVVPERRSSGDEPRSAATLGKSHVKKLPEWMTNLPRKNPPTCTVRSFGHEFLIQAAGFFPEDVVNVDSMALELEDAIFQYASEKTKELDGDIETEDINSAPWVKLYWKMVHLLVAAICGKHDRSSLHPLILDGKYASPMDVVTIPESNLRRSFENLPLLGHVRD